MPKNKTIILNSIDNILLSKAANQSINSNAVTKVLLDTVVSTSNYFSFNTGTNDITISENGLYVVSYAKRWGAGVIGSRVCQIFVNGVIAWGDTNTAVASLLALPYYFGSTLVPLVSGDIIDMRVLQSQGAAVNLLAVANRSPLFGITKVD